MLVFGGPKTNEVSKLFMRLLGEALPLTVKGETIVWGTDVYEGEIRRGCVVRDYGFVVRVDNPLNRSRRIVLLGGCHTHGVVAAARWLAENGGKLRTSKNICVLVESDVLPDGHVIAPRVVRTKQIKIKGSRNEGHRK